MDSSSGCLDDEPGTGGSAAAIGVLAGGSCRTILRISAPPAPQVDGAFRSFISAGTNLRVAVSELRCLPGGFAVGVYSELVFWVDYLGREFWAIAAAGFFRFFGKEWGRRYPESWRSSKNFSEN